MTTLLTALASVVVALAGGGLVGLLLFKPQRGKLISERDNLISEAADHVVVAIDKSMGRLEDELSDCLERVASLEAELGIEQARTSALAREVRRLGGNPATILQGGLK